MACVASELKAEREKRNIPLAQIAADTRISLHHLESLEEGRYGDLPGGIYNRAFLKAYCEILNLDQREIMNRYEAEMSPSFEKQFKPRTQISPVRSFRLSPVLIWSIMLLISASGVFLSRKWIANIFSPYFSHTPVANLRYESPQQQSPQPSSPAISQPSTPTTVMASSVPPKSAPPPAVPAPDTIGSPAIFGAVPPDLPAPPKEATPVPANAPALRLDMQIVDECWISVSSDGHPITRKTLEPGETQSFDAAKQLSVVLGNAGGVQLKINGKAVKPLGKAGEVIKMIINQENLQEFVDQTAG